MAHLAALHAAADLVVGAAAAAAAPVAVVAEDRSSLAGVVLVAQICLF